MTITLPACFSPTPSVFNGISQVTALAMKRVDEALKDEPGPVSYDRISELLKKYKAEVEEELKAENSSFPEKKEQDVPVSSVKPSTAEQDAISEVEKLKKTLLPVVSAKFDKLLLVICDEETTQRALSPEKAEKAYKLFTEIVKKQFNVSEQWDMTFSDIRQTLTQNFWEEAMKHHVFLMLLGINGQKQNLHMAFDAVIQNLEEEKKTPGNNNGQKSGKN